MTTEQEMVEMAKELSPSLSERLTQRDMYDACLMILEALVGLSMRDGQIDAHSLRDAALLMREQYRHLCKLSDSANDVA